MPGTQFIDSFDPPKLPYVAKGDWVPLFADQADCTRIVCTNVDGALRIYTVAPRADGKVVLIPPDPAVIVGDFHASVDILKWPGPGKDVGPWVQGTIDTTALVPTLPWRRATASNWRGPVLWDRA